MIERKEMGWYETSDSLSLSLSLMPILFTQFLLSSYLPFLFSHYHTPTLLFLTFPFSPLFLFVSWHFLLSSLHTPLFIPSPFSFLILSLHNSLILSFPNIINPFPSLFHVPPTPPLPISPMSLITFKSSEKNPIVSMCVIGNYQTELKQAQLKSNDDLLRSYIHGGKFFRQVICPTLNNLLGQRGHDEWIDLLSRDLIPPPDIRAVLLDLLNLTKTP